MHQNSCATITWQLLQRTQQLVSVQCVYLPFSNCFSYWNFSRSRAFVCILHEPTVNFDHCHTHTATFHLDMYKFQSYEKVVLSTVYTQSLCNVFMCPLVPFLLPSKFAFQANNFVVSNKYTLQRTVRYSIWFIHSNQCRFPFFFFSICRYNCRTCSCNWFGHRN